MQQTVRITRAGPASLGITIHPRILTAAGWKVGDYLILNVNTDKTVTITLDE